MVRRALDPRVTSLKEIGRNISSDNTFTSEFYLTDAERDVENPMEQQLEHRLRYGSRPDITSILRSLGDQAKQDGKDRVAVLACGPMPMVQAVLDTSMALSKEMKVQFDVHTELLSFNFS